MGIPLSKFTKTQAENFNVLVGDEDTDDFADLPEIEFEHIEIPGVPQDILDNLGRLKTAINDELPQVRQILTIILKQLQESGDCLYIMTDEQIALLYDASLGEAKKVITPVKEKKAAAEKKKKVKSVLDDYVNAIGTGGLSVNDL